MVWKDLVNDWRGEMPAYFETDIPITNALTESINRLIKDKNLNDQDYSFEVIRARMLYTTKHKKKSPQTEEFSFQGGA